MPRRILYYANVAIILIKCQRKKQNVLQIRLFFAFSFEIQYFFMDFIVEMTLFYQMICEIEIIYLFLAKIYKIDFWGRLLLYLLTKQPKKMRKIYAILTFMVFALAASAQVTLPRATFKLDFEGATSVSDFNGTQVGDGELRVSSDANFGTYYQNCPNSAVATKATNYLRVELGDGLKNAGLKTQDNTISLCFWVNPTVANTQFSSISYFYSVLYAIYGAGNRGLGSADAWNGPMWSQNTRGWMQINDWAGRWDDFGDDENVNGANKIGTEWLAQKTEEVTTTDDEGNEVVENMPTGFDDNWHFVAMELSAANNTASIYVDGELFNQWNCKSGFYAEGESTFFGQLGGYADLYLGGVAQWTWADPDPAFAYDDFFIYAGGLNAEQQELIMKIKRGDVDDDIRLAIAQNEYIEAVTEYEQFLDKLQNYNSLFVELEELVAGFEDTVDLDPSVEKYNNAAAAIRAKIAEQEKIIDAAEVVKKQIEQEQQYAEATNYPGKSEYDAALSQCQNDLDDVTTIAKSEEVAKSVSDAKGKYVTSQELPTDGTGINVTALIQHPWFCNPDAEPTANGDGTYSFPYQESHSYAENTTPSDQNAGGWVNGNSFTVDDARVNWTEGRITWSNWHNKTNVGTLDVHQVITGLPEGYYTVSADWITNAAPTTQHTYAKSGDVTKVSEYLDNQGWDTQTWTTLTTDKIYVGADGVLTVGGESSTVGTAYRGWFCVTNFTLTYFGTEVDLSNDLNAKKEEVQGLIDQLTLKGDIKNANEEVASIVAMDDSYEAVEEMTQMVNKLKDVIAKEAIVQNTVNDYNSTTSSSENVSVGINAVKAYLASLINADDATYEISTDVQAVASKAREYNVAVVAAEDWNTEGTTTMLNSQVAALKGADPAEGPTVETLQGYIDELVKSMKESLTTKTASEESPVDITAFLVNPSFTGDSSKGWTIENASAGLAYSEIEFYNTNFNIYQTINDMPSGYYRFALQGYYRDGTDAQAYEKSQAVDEEGNPAPTNVLNAKIYGNAQEADIQSWADFSLTGEEFTGYYSPNINDETIEAEQVIYFPTTMEAAHYLFDTKKLNVDGNSVNFWCGQGTITVGAKKETTIASDWTIFDNLRLYYLGQEAPEDLTGIYAVQGDSKSEVEAVYSLNGSRLNGLQKGLNIIRHKDGSVKKVLVK